MARTAVLGLPRVGPARELKFALEAHWSGATSDETLLETARALRAANWQRARDTGIDVIPSGDFSLYDHVLDTAWGLGALPARFADADRSSLADYFALARGDARRRPLEMTKWFDTNYHYLVPELAPGQRFALRADHWVDAFEEAAELRIETRPVVLGPLSFLLLSKGIDRPLELLDELVPVYGELLAALRAAGAAEVQLDEPCLVLDREPYELDAFAAAFATLRDAGPALALATYFAGLDAGATLERVCALEPAELHVDLVRAPGQLEPALAALAGAPTRLSLGVLDGRNVWAADLDAALERVDAATEALGSERVTIAPSCSMLHLPHEAARETGLDDELRSWLAFSAERLDELRTLGQAAAAPPDVRATLLAQARRRRNSHLTSARTNDPAVRARLAQLQPGDYERDTPAPERRAAQRERVPLPQLPTTTIGSFPQTDEIRAARAALRAGRLSRNEYEQAMQNEIERVVAFQEQIGLDVLVHGEPERSDMVEYFAAQLDGFAFSEHGWVQSYGSRCVKPPILFGDVSRPWPITVGWWRHAQGLTERPVKGMLTGPVTMLQWSFVRDDQPRDETCRQIAVAMQDEVRDLEAAGCFAIQVDEAAFREGLPLQRRDQDDYLRWAVDCFRLTVAPAGERTQVHTHMCYSEFNDVIDHILRMDADVISVEASRSGMEVLEAFTASRRHFNDIGPGVHDIHSPRVPSVEEIERLLELAEARIGRERLWVNPDCGLKTRAWSEVRPALEHMVAAAHRRRAAVPVPA